MSTRGFFPFRILSEVLGPSRLASSSNVTFRLCLNLHLDLVVSFVFAFVRPACCLRRAVVLHCSVPSRIVTSPPSQPLSVFPPTHPTENPHEKPHETGEGGGGGGDFRHEDVPGVGRRIGGEQSECPDDAGVTEEALGQSSRAGKEWKLGKRRGTGAVMPWAPAPEDLGIVPRAGEKVETFFFSLLF